jgi:hypothetical protein
MRDCPEEATGGGRVEGSGVGGAELYCSGGLELDEELLDSWELEEFCGDSDEMRGFLAALGMTPSEGVGDVCGIDVASVGFSGSTRVRGLVRARSSARA